MNDYKVLKQKIDYLNFKLDQAESELRRWESGDLQNIRLSKESIASGLEKTIKGLKEEQEELVKQRVELIKFINRFEDLDNKILVKKYIEGKSLYDISEELAYSYGHIKRCHGQLVKTIKFVDEYILDEIT